MSCNCNTADPNCEPCAFCTPPGVKCLPDCNPEDPCPEKIDLCCIMYSGPDEPCSNITTGMPLCDLIDQFFEVEFPASECCRLEMSIDLLPTVSTTTTTTTTKPPSRNIKFKVADVILENYCGPHNITLTGPNTDYFLLENNELFLTENTGQTGIYSININIDDHFIPKRFDTIQQNYTIELGRCDATISKPLEIGRAHV